MRKKKIKLGIYSTTQDYAHTEVNDGNCWGAGKLAVNFKYEHDGGKRDVLTVTLQNPGMLDPKFIIGDKKFQLIINGNWETKIWRSVFTELLDYLDEIDVKEFSEC